MEELNFVDKVQSSMSYIDPNIGMEGVLGKCLNMPNMGANSGSRCLMSSTHQSHSLVLSRGEVPYVATGYENRYGERSSSIITADDDYEVIAKISKFAYAPDHHYYLIVRSFDRHFIDVIERISYKYRTEMYGYLHNNSMMDMYSTPGTVIPKGTILRRSTGFDRSGNRTSGCNVNVAYLALDHNMEDSVVISERCSERLSAPLIKNVEVVLNENDIPLNIYGDDNIYKVYPDIGEEVKDGILLVYRREKREEAIYTQSVQRLQELMMSDDKITVEGRVIDINVRCNNIDHISKNAYNQQIFAYYNDRIRMDNEVVNAIGPYETLGYEMSYNLKELYSNCKKEINGVKNFNKKTFSNLIIEFTILEDRKLGIGDKVADRYGGKGVISKIIPTELMPKMANGMPIDMIKNSSTMYNRENAGQIFEMEINYISMSILDRLRNSPMMNPVDAMNEILKFIKLQSPQQYDKMVDYLNTLDNTGLSYFLESILSKTCIPVSNQPISETMSIDKLGMLYQAFPWIKQENILVPVEDSRGEIRFIKSRRPIITAPIYCIRLKQFAEEKFSAASLSSTNLRNENVKSKASKNYREPNSNTPIKFGQMESGDLDHIGTEYVVINLLLHSLSPHGRRLVEQLATEDPYDVDVKLDTKSKNRSVEILNARLKIMGYRINFNKTKKIKKYPVLVPAIFFGQQSDISMIPAIDFMEEGYDYDHYYKAMDDIQEIKKRSAVLIDAIEFTESLDVVNDMINK